MPKPTNKQELLDEAEKEYEALKKQLAEFTPGRHKWTGISTLASYVDANTGTHYRWAQTGLRRGTNEWSGEAPAVKPVENSPAVMNTRVTGGKPALLIIDVQRELFQRALPIYDEDRLLANIRLLADKAHAAKVPVFWVQHSSKEELVEGTDGWKLHPAFIPLKSDNFIRKHHGNAFQDTPLKTELDALHARTVVVAGLLTDACIQATCNGAHELGYDVVLVKDAHSNYNVKARDVINEWNATLSHDGVVRLESTVEVDFEVPGTK